LTRVTPQSRPEAQLFRYIGPHLIRNLGSQNGKEFSAQFQNHGARASSSVNSLRVSDELACDKWCAFLWQNKLDHLLANKDFKTVLEGAQEYMEGEIDRGRTIDEIHMNGADLQRRIEDMQVRIEGELSAVDVAFLDGAVPGSLAWYRVFGLNPNEIVLECFHHRYASVFILERLPLQLDGLRFEDDAITSFLDEWIARDYSALGYNVVRVPVLAPEERLAFILEKLSKQGLM